VTAAAGPTPAAIRTAFERYVAALTDGDAGAVTDLFAHDATIEDPVGAPPVTGRAAILAFYRSAIARAGGPTVRLSGPVRIAGAFGAAPLQSDAVRDGRAVRLDIIDVMRFDDAGRILSMTAYWGPENVSPR
jgi:steroid delta-isomerase